MKHYLGYTMKFRLINKNHWRFWIWYAKLSDKFFHRFDRFNEKLIDLSRYEDCDDDHYQLALIVWSSNQV